MKVSPHFSRDEFACRCGCGFAAVDAVLLECLETVRTTLDAPVVITSGCRCADHNAAIGGSPKSKHMHGMAADFKVVGVDPDTVADVCELLPKVGGIGRYDGWTHIDVRPNRVTWSA